MSLLAVIVVGLTPIAATPAATQFEDVPSDHRFATEIAWLAAEGITNGCTTDSFCPDEPVTRGQMAAFLVRALPDLQQLDPGSPFDDVPPTHTFFTEIGKLATAGITQGCDPAGTLFCPEDPVGRGQMAAFLVRALPDLQQVDPGSPFDDVPPSHTFYTEIGKLAKAGITQGCDPAGTLYCPNDPVSRGQMAAFFYRALAGPTGPTTTTTPSGQVAMKLVPVVTEGLDQPLFLTHAPGDSTRLFIVEKGGAIRVVRNGDLRDSPFLEVEVNTDGERGLLGLAFHPGYASNRRFFVAYTDDAGTIHVDEFLRSDNANFADEGSASRVISIPHPGESNHNGGMLAFTPDGLLLIGTGDGGGSGDPNENAQDTDSLLGKILRIDVDGSDPYNIPADNPFADGQGGAPEVWLWGLRNPWRFSVDAAKNGVFIGDVGQGDFEEIDAISLGAGSANLGWDTMEGNACYDPPSGCPRSGLTLPIHDYGRDVGGAVTGGYVYRGSDLTGRKGLYFFGDYVTGRVWTLRYNNGVVSNLTERPKLSVPSLASFGVDAGGELYLISLGGSVYRVAPD
jgi:glucose/arabinose dehydrogenase